MTLSAIAMKAEIKLPRMFDDNMVMQRNSNCNIWGTADALKTVTITTSWNGKTYKVKVINVTGDWKLTFDATGITTNTQLPNDWSLNENEKIKYYSGSAEYSTHLKCDILKGQKATLSLGRVCDIAHVFVNNVDCGWRGHHLMKWMSRKL